MVGDPEDRSVGLVRFLAETMVAVTDIPKAVARVEARTAGLLFWRVHRCDM